MSPVRSRALACAGLVFLGCAFVYLKSPVGNFGDSYYTLLVSETLLTRGTARLDAYFEFPAADGYPGPLEADGLPYQLDRHEGHIDLAFPPGSAILSVPAVAVARAFGDSTIAADGSYAVKTEERLQKRLSGLLSAAAVALFFLAARQRLPMVPALTIALAAAFATPLWSITSRALWSHTWLQVLMAGAVLLLLFPPERRDGRWAFLLGSLLGLSYWVRPTAAVPILVVVVWVVIRVRRRLPVLLLALLFWLGLLVAWSWAHFGEPLPPYFHPARLGSSQFTVALLGHLVSPSRGLLVYTPVLLVIGWLLWRDRRWVADGDLAILAGGVIFVHWLLVASFPHWWGGWSYGPRLMSDGVPWMVLLAILAVEGRTRALAATGGRRRLEFALAVTLLLASCTLHGIGAFSRAAGRWNATPVDIDHAPERLWDWSDPQFLAWRRR